MNRYEQPELEIIEIEYEDIVCLSGSNEGEGGWIVP